MKVVILAAGKGSRLGDTHLPKPLTRLVNGKSILQTQLDVLKQYVSLDQIVVVVGYHKEEIIDRFPDLMFVFSPHFSQENTSKSLLRALNKIDDDVLWLNGDVVMHPSVIASVLNDPKTSMVVNVGSVGEEEVKYRLDDEQRIVEVSKQVVEADGEALGINFWKKEDLEALRTNLQQCLDTDYFEKGIELCIDQGMPVWSVAVNHDLCTEIDFPEDLKKANDMLRLWSS